jgi:hypothetical protein
VGRDGIRKQRKGIQQPGNQLIALMIDTMKRHLEGAFN